MRNKQLSFSGLLIGAGLGGFVDGILFHQLLQWHHLICITEFCEPRSIDELRQQNVQDGFFHLAMWIMTTIGIVILFLAGKGIDRPWSGKVFFGSLFIGWGTFDFLEGIIDHQILGIHHVLPGRPYEVFADMAYLAVGLALVILGLILVLCRR